MIKKSNIVRRKLRSFLIRAFSFLENNGNATFAKNGEKWFVRALFSVFGRTPQHRVVLFDIGANTGCYSEMLLDQARQKNVRIELHVFEPAAKCVDELKARFASDVNVHIVDRAASNETESTRIYFDKAGSSLASLYRRNLNAYAIEMCFNEEVQTIRLDEYIRYRDVEHIHFLKLDVEGHEVAALEGMGEYLDGGFVDFIQFEYGGANLDSGTTLMKLFALLEQKGFKVGKIMRRGVELRTYEAWMENYQYSNYVAISSRLVDVIG